MTVSPIATALAPGAFRIGSDPSDKLLRGNSYVLIDSNSDNSGRFTLWIDPGSGASLEQSVGALQAVGAEASLPHTVFINHQDPGSLAPVRALMEQDATPYLLTSEESWQLFGEIDFPAERFVNTELYPNGLRAPGGSVYVPVQSRYCHFVGSRMLYDPARRILFSGSLFSSISEPRSSGVFATEEDWLGVQAFHQIYMPTSAAIRRATAEIRSLRPEVEIIAPQYGRIIQGDLVESWLERIDCLQTGVELFDSSESEANFLPKWEEILHAILDIAPSKAKSLLMDALKHRAAFQGLVKLQGDTYSLEARGKYVVEQAVSVASQALSAEEADLFRYRVFLKISSLGLPAPKLDLNRSSLHSEEAPELVALAY